MKHCISIFLFFISVGILFAQVRGARGTVMIKDNRSSGIAVYDTSTTGHKAGDVVVKKVLRNYAGKQVDAYDVYYYRMHDKKLYAYYATLSDTLIYDKFNFDRATFVWQLDTALKITLKRGATTEAYGRTSYFTLPDSPGGPVEIIKLPYVPGPVIYVKGVKGQKKD